MCLYRVTGAALLRTTCKGKKGRSKGLGSKSPPMVAWAGGRGAQRWPDFEKEQNFSTESKRRHVTVRSAV